VLLSALLVGTPLAASAASASCSALLAGRRALVGLRFDELLDRDLLRLVRLGLVAKLSVEVSLLRKRLLFPRRLGRAQAEAELRFSEEGGLFLLDGRPVADPQRLSLERMVLELEQDEEPEGLEVQVRTELRVVTAQSLGEVVRWIAGSDGAGRSALSRNLLGAVADDLTRSVQADCPVRRAGGR
jgi:hypothetical protein